MKRTPIAVNIEIDYKPEVAEKLSRLYDILLADQSAHKPRIEGESIEQEIATLEPEAVQDIYNLPVYTHDGLDNI